MNFIDSSIINKPSSTYYYSLFPNPASGYFFVRLTDKEINPQQVELIDAAGKIQLLEFEIFSPTLIRVNAAQMAKGLYVFRLISKDAVRTEKVQIE
ncbi:MAG: T9SS type A sorting domain-containing protein [Bacteroidia bacterium]|nr:T9SS type A sorting domain-containing protein [Bacteroidia bacterium]MCO5252928.1 T9SS type A sorting domain-containing protein [Bacteroidota bacterium]